MWNARGLARGAAKSPLALRVNEGFPVDPVPALSETLGKYKSNRVDVYQFWLLSTAQEQHNFHWTD